MRLSKKHTPEEIAKVLYGAELNIAQAERKVPIETDPKKQVKYLEKLAESIKELEDVNDKISEQ